MTLTATWHVDTLVIEDRDGEAGLVGKVEMMRGDEVKILTALLNGTRLRARTSRLDVRLEHGVDDGIRLISDWTRVPYVKRLVHDAYTLTLDAERAGELIALLHASLSHPTGRVPTDGRPGASPMPHTISLIRQAGWTFDAPEHGTVIAHYAGYAVPVDAAIFRRAADTYGIPIAS